MSALPALTRIKASPRIQQYHFGAWLSLVERSVRDREVGGSNPLAPTNQFNNLRLPAMAAVFRLWPICGQLAQDALPFAVEQP